MVDSTAQPADPPPSGERPAGSAGPPTGRYEVWKIYLTCLGGGFAALALIGWWAGVAPLYSWGTALVVPPMTAASVLLLAVGTLLADLVHTVADPHPPLPTSIVRVLAAIAGLLPVATMAGQSSVAEQAVNRLLAPAGGGTGSMTGGTALALLALAFSVIVGVHPRLARLDALAATTAMTIGVLGVVGGLLGLPAMTGTGGAGAGLALPTAVMLLCLAAGRLCGLPVTIPGREVWASAQGRRTAITLLPLVVGLGLVVAVLSTLLDRERASSSGSLLVVLVALGMATLADRSWAMARQVALADQRQELVAEVTGVATALISEGVLVHTTRSFRALLGFPATGLGWSGRAVAELTADIPALRVLFELPGESRRITWCGPDGTDTVLTARVAGAEWNGRAARLLILRAAADRPAEPDPDAEQASQRQYQEYLDELELIDRDRRLAYAADCSPYAIMTIDAEGRILDWNPAAEQTYGYPEAEAVGAGLSLLMTPEKGAADMAVMVARLARGDAVGPIEVEHTRRDGGRFWVSLCAAPMGEHDGAAESMVTTRDVTASREALLQSAMTIEALPTGAAAIDADGVIRTANWQMTAIFGYHPDELVGHNVDMLLPEGLRAEHARLRSSYQAKPRALLIGERAPLLGRRADGSEVSVEIGLRPVPVAGGTGVLAIVTEARPRETRPVTGASGEASREPPA